MDVLRPELMWIGSRCYRVNQTSTTREQRAEPSTGGYVEEDLYEDEENEIDFDIKMNENGKFETSFHVPSIFHALIIGKQGTTRKRIESETKTQIKVPKQYTDGDIVVLGNSRQAVTASRQRIELIVLSARAKQPFTHFLSIPVATSEIKSNFIKFKESVLELPRKIYNLEDSLFQKPEKLHLTICTLSLMDNDDRSLAAELLQDCQENVIKPILNEFGPVKQFCAQKVWLQK